MIANELIDKVCLHEFHCKPNTIKKKTNGICNEVFEIELSEDTYILRLNILKRNIIGTKKFLPLFKELRITTPEIVAESYSKRIVPFHYQILTKVAGDDLENVMPELVVDELKLLAREISNIINKFRNIQSDGLFGELTGTSTEKYTNLYSVVLKQCDVIRKRNKVSCVVDNVILNILDEIVTKQSKYLSSVKSTLYFDDMVSKNVMISNGKFNGLVDLDFLRRGDILDLIGRIAACWLLNEKGNVYVNELVRYQKLGELEIFYVKIYAILNLVNWISEEGLKFNGNSSGVVHWSNVSILRNSVIAFHRSFSGIELPDCHSIL